MTPEQRAEKIVDWLSPTRIKHAVAVPSALEQRIAAEIKAYAEDYANDMFWPFIEKAKEQEREECAKLFEPGPYPDCPVQMTYQEAYDKIRARTSGRVCDQYHCGHAACNKAREEER